MLTWIETNSRAITYNLKQFKKTLGPGVLLMPVIKRNAYGHGFLETAHIVGESAIVDRICVASLDEAVSLLKHGIKKPIVILSFYELDSPDILLAIRNNVAFPVYDKKQISTLDRYAKSLKKTAIVHVKIDTGTSRLGILPHEAVNFATYIKKFSHIKWEGLWSHFSSSENDPMETARQKTIFDQVVSDLKQAGSEPPLKHFACTASTILYPDTHYNAVRVGLGTYGLYPSLACQKKITLKPALAWHTRLIQVKNIPAGTSISYGKTFTTKRPTVLGILPIGYYDGYDRKLSSKAHVLVKGKRCAVLGRICMNLTMIDLTDLNTPVKPGEQVTLIGNSKKATISADELAENSTTINYEIVDRLNPLIPRIIL